MKLSLVALCTLAAALAFAELTAVTPVGTGQAQDLLLQVESSSLSATGLPTLKDAGAVQATPIPRSSNPWAMERPDRGFADFGRFPRDFSATPLPSYRYGGQLRYGEGGRNSLDLPACSLGTTTDETISYYSGIVAGDGYKVWVDPANCPGCAPVYPFRVDSVRIQIVQDDGSPADTVTIGIDLECAYLEPAQFCNGPGRERFAALFDISLPLDTADTFLSVYEITLPLSDAWVDGPFFLGLFHLGNTLADPNFFHPNVALGETELPAADSCKVWANLGGTWEKWLDIWNPPAPGYPIASIFGECNAPSAPVIEPCPVECGSQRISQPLAYYISGTTAIWQYFDLDASDFPYHPTLINFDLYYDTTGTTTDTTEYLITYGCPSDGNICCVPSDVLCAGVATIVRENGADNYFQAVSLDLSAMTCCLNTDFFVGVIILRHTGTALNIPKFLSSNRVNEQTAGNDITACHQWDFSGGGYVSYPSGTQIGWFDMSIAGSCGACPTDPMTCTTQTINCATATPLTCNNTVQVFNNQTTVGGSTTVSQYCCAPWDESGPEKVYSIAIPANGSLAAAVSNTGGQDLDIFVLSACNPGASIACSDSAVNITGLTAGTYYIVVDGFDGAEGTFTLTLTAPCTGAAGCPTTLCGTGLNGNSTILVWDGELLPNGNTAFLCQGTTVGGNDMVIKIVDGSCNLVSTIDIGGNAINQVSRGLAFDDRDGSWWTHTFVAPKKLRHYGPTGTLIAEFDSAYFGAQGSTHSFSGLAFDANNNHLWGIMSSLGRYTEFDVSNVATPVIRQAGLMPIHAGTGYSAAGLDYDECNDRMLVSTFRGSPLTRGEIECWQDVDPAGIGGGVTLLATCNIAAGGIAQNWGLSRSAVTNQVLLPNLDAVANTDHRLWTTTTPCGAVAPAAPTAATAYRSANDILVSWNAPAPGRYIIYRTSIKNNDGNPDGGADPNFVVEATITVTTIGTQTYTDVGAFTTEGYLNYVVVAACP